MTDEEAKAVFESMDAGTQAKILKWQKQNGLTFAAAVAAYREPMPTGNPDNAIAPNTLAGKMRDRKLGRR